MRLALIIEYDGARYSGFQFQANAPSIQAELELAVRRLTGETVTLHTMEYLEGNPTGTHFIPRLIGLLSEADREFLQLFTRVKGISIRKALRVMSISTQQLAAAIEDGDTALLCSLPEIGKKTATQIVSDLRGKLDVHIGSSARSPVVAEMTDSQQVALGILVQWGDRRADAQRWIAAAVAQHPDLVEPDEIVRAAYRTKQTV